MPLVPPLSVLAATRGTRCKHTCKTPPGMGPRVSALSRADRGHRQRALCCHGAWLSAYPPSAAPRRNARFTQLFLISLLKKPKRGTLTWFSASTPCWCPTDTGNGAPPALLAAPLRTLLAPARSSLNRDPQKQNLHDLFQGEKCLDCSSAVDANASKMNDYRTHKFPGDESPRCRPRPLVPTGRELQDQCCSGRCVWAVLVNKNLVC